MSKPKIYRFILKTPVVVLHVLVINDNGICFCERTLTMEFGKTRQNFRFDFLYNMPEDDIINRLNYEFVGKNFDGLNNIDNQH